MLLKRSVTLQGMAQEGSNEKAFIAMYAAHVTSVSNNERSMQKRQLKKLFLNHDSEYAMITNYEVGSGSPTTGEQEMGISKSLTPEFETVQDLRKALCSPEIPVIRPILRWVGKWKIEVYKSNAAVPH